MNDEPKTPFDRWSLPWGEHSALARLERSFNDAAESMGKFTQAVGGLMRERIGDELGLPIIDREDYFSKNGFHKPRANATKAERRALKKAVGARQLRMYEKNRRVLMKAKALIVDIKARGGQVDCADDISFQLKD